MSKSNKPLILEIGRVLFKSGKRVLEKEYCTYHATFCYSENYDNNHRNRIGALITNVVPRCVIEFKSLSCAPNTRRKTNELECNPSI